MAWPWTSVDGCGTKQRTAQRAPKHSRSEGRDEQALTTEPARPTAPVECVVVGCLTAIHFGSSAGQRSKRLQYLHYVAPDQDSRLPQLLQVFHRMSGQAFPILGVQYALAH